MGILQTLLRRNVSAVQVIGYAAANALGLAIIVAAVQFYMDASGALRGDDPLSRDFLTISKQVSGLNALGMGNVEFSDNEIKRLEAQPWVRRVGRYTAAGFGVSATLPTGAGSMASQLFLESVPDDFLDTLPQAWNTASDTVPVILSREYLAMYNFGFAATRNLPRLSEDVIGAVPLTLTFDGNGYHERRPARIAGFSSRLNTIAVPEEFLREANLRYGNGAEPSSRLIVEVSKPGDPLIQQYMDANGYVIAGDKTQTARAARMLTVLSGAVAAVGAVITLLAFFIFALSITLLLQRNREKMHRLMTLGYTPGQTARPYIILVVVLNGIILAAACAGAVAFSQLWAPQLAEIGIQPTSPAIPCLTALAIAILTTGANVALILVKARKAF